MRKRWGNEGKTMRDPSPATEGGEGGGASIGSARTAWCMTYTRMTCATNAMSAASQPKGIAPVMPIQ